MNIMALFPHLPWLREQLVRLGRAAVLQRDPAVYAAVFVEELPEALDVNLVGQLLSQEDWYQKLIQLEPRLDREDLLPWFTRVRGGILRLLQGPADVADTTGSVLPPAPPAPAAAPAVEKMQAKADQSERVARPTKSPSLDGSE